MIQKDTNTFRVGFRKCRIHPQNCDTKRFCIFTNEVLERESSEIKNAFSETIPEYLQRKQEEFIITRRTKRKRVNIVPGKSISSADIGNPYKKSNTGNTGGIQPILSTSTYFKNIHTNLKLVRKKAKNILCQNLNTCLIMNRKKISFETRQ